MKIYFGGNYEKNNSSLYIPTSKCPIGISILTEIFLYRLVNYTTDSLWCITHFFFMDIWPTKTSGQGQYEI